MHWVGWATRSIACPSMQLRTQGSWMTAVQLLFNRLNLPAITVCLMANFYTHLGQFEYCLRSSKIFLVRKYRKHNIVPFIVSSFCPLSSCRGADFFLVVPLEPPPSPSYIVAGSTRVCILSNQPPRNKLCGLPEPGHVEGPVRHLSSSSLSFALLQKPCPKRAGAADVKMLSSSAMSMRPALRPALRFCR